MLIIPWANNRMMPAYVHIEFKREGESPEPHQVAAAARLVNMGCHTAVVRTINDFTRLLASYGIR